MKIRKSLIKVTLLAGLLGALVFVALVNLGMDASPEASTAVGNLQASGKENGCEEKIWQLNFSYEGLTWAEYDDTVSPLAEEFAKVNGLRWKVWLINEDNQEAGGIYLFKDQASLDAFLASDLAATVGEAFDLEHETFDVLYDLTEITQGPVAEHCADDDS
jgi:hypothetical protein